MFKMQSCENHPHRCFFQPLLPDFLKTFSIPVLYLKHLELELKGHALETIVLMRDQNNENESRRHWLIKVEGGRHFKDGWKDFALHYNLQVGDFVVFQHQGHLLFQVSVFDPATACDRHYLDNCADAYVDAYVDVKPSPKPKGSFEQRKITGRCKHRRISGSLKQRKCLPVPSCVVKLTSYSVKKSVVFLPRPFSRSSGLANRTCDVELVDGKERSWPAGMNFKKSDGQVYIKRGWKQFLTANCFKPGNVIRFQLLKDRKKPILKCCRSRN